MEDKIFNRRVPATEMFKMMMGLAMMAGDGSPRLPDAQEGFHNYQHKERPKGKRAKRRAKAKMKGGKCNG